MPVAELTLEMQLRLLTGEDGVDAVRAAAVVAEAALKAVLGKEPGAGAGLGEMIGEARARAELRDRVGEKLLKELAWVNEQRIRAVHFKGGREPLSVDDAVRAADVVTRLLGRAELLGEEELAKIRREAEWRASMPARSSLLKLDRAAQRAELDDLLTLPSRLLVLVLDGEVEQGHEHFAEVVRWRLRAIAKGHWRELRVDWPAPSSCPGMRFAELAARLASCLELRVRWPDADPFGDGAGPWEEALATLRERIARTRARLCLRHTLGWLDAGDPALVESYLENIWRPAAAGSGERLVTSFEIVRAEHTGFPFFARAWRLARRERHTARRIAALVESLEMGAPCRLVALDELKSIGAPDLVQWLRNERGEPLPRAEAQAAEVITTTRNGRFELVLRRIAAMEGPRDHAANVRHHP
jgi:HEPN domain-containing protein